jgi:hypothetical protein
MMWDIEVVWWWLAVSWEPVDHAREAMRRLMEGRENTT